MAPARLTVRVHPGARRDALEGRRGEVLHAGVTASDAGPDADRALIALLAGRLGVAEDQVSILFGESERLKEVAVAGLDQATLDARLTGPRTVAGARSGRAVAGAAVVVAIAVIVVLLTSGSGGGAGGTGPSRSDGGVAVAATTTAARAGSERTRGRRAGAARSRHRVDPGTLPPTSARPVAHTRGFAIRMHALWRAIAGGPAADARSAFFPETAYVQLKSVGYPASDWLYRLYADYRLDIAAAHALLGAHARTTKLLRTDTVAAYGHWVPPGICDNRYGYWELPNSRLVYETAGQVRSIGIASMISWRGVWYVVHLGAVTRSGATGIVSAPSAGPGTVTASNTC